MNELKYWINDMDEWIFHTLEEDFSMQTKRENTDNTKMKNIHREREIYGERRGIQRKDRRLERKIRYEREFLKGWTGWVYSVL